MIYSIEVYSIEVWTKKACQCDNCQDARKGNWEETPRWHPARLLGWTIRRRVTDTMGRPGQQLDSWYEYADPRETARDQLKGQFDV